jgi:hypothetical protein
VSLLRLEPVTPSPEYKSEALPLEPPTGLMEMSLLTYVVKQPIRPVMAQVTFQAMNFSCSLNVAITCPAPPRLTPLHSCSSFMRPSLSIPRAGEQRRSQRTHRDRQTDHKTTCPSWTHTAPPPLRNTLCLVGVFLSALISGRSLLDITCFRSYRYSEGHPVSIYRETTKPRTEKWHGCKIRVF